MRLGDDPSYDVRFWAIRVYKGKRGTSYTVRWQVAGSPNQRTFATRRLAESFRAGLLTAARGGGQFFASDGLPASMRTDLAERTWYAHACALIDMKWAHASPSHRRGLAEALVWVTTAMVTSSRDAPDDNALRKALFHWSFNVTARATNPSKRPTSPTTSPTRRLGSQDGQCHCAASLLPPRSVARWTRSARNSTARQLPHRRSPGGAPRCSVPSSTPSSLSCCRTTRSSS
jgi:hypothetical protein